MIEGFKRGYNRGKGNDALSSTIPPLAHYFAELLKQANLLHKFIINVHAL